MDNGSNVYVNSNFTTTPIRCIYILDHQYMDITIRYIYISILVILAVYISCMNILLILGLFKTNSKLSLSKKLFVYLSFSDLFTGLVTAPYQVSMVVLGSDASCFQVDLQSFLNVFTPGLSMFTILSISIARYVSVAKPTFFRRNANSPWVFALMIGQAIMALAVAVWYASARDAIQLGSFLSGVTFFCFTAVGGAIVINVFLYLQLSKKSLENLAQQQIQTQNYHKEVIKTLIIISIILSVCYLPNGIVFSVVGYHVFMDDTNNMYNNLIPWVYLPILFNAGINSIVYIWRDRKIARYIKSLFFSKITMFRLLYHTNNQSATNASGEKESSPMNHRRVQMIRKVSRRGSLILESFVESEV